MDMDERATAPETEDEEVPLTAGQFFMEMVKVFMLAAAIIIPVRVFLFQPFFVQGSSMVPNFEDGEYLVVNEFGFKQTDVGVPGAHFFTVLPKLRLADDEYFVLGDNRTASYDSRMIGPIKKDMIVGRVLFRAWPINRVSAY